MTRPLTPAPPEGGADAEGVALLGGQADVKGVAGTWKDLG